MRLERLEINGFKSFSDRSELSFDRGVTAIVGPNGCGKSNVADAITWVMGEQSAKSLRGERMEDVIFSGSDARKATASAEVRLRFSGVLVGQSHTNGTHSHATIETGNGHHDDAVGDGHGHAAANGNGHVTNGNGDGHHGEAEELGSVARDIEVTRRLYRSGESEYLIDGQSCRLRDIHDLLMDTGLGAKAYAIIEQGKIGLILSSRPTDRRMLIEEAAGVTKYKARRRAAELKLDAAQLNLTRIDDIVFEVEKQRGTLKRQAAKARRYRKLRDEVRRWEKVLFARKYRQLAEVIQSVRSRLEGARERESTAAARVAEAESDLARVRIELAEAESVAVGAREAAHARELSITTRQQQMTFDREQTESLRARIEQVSAEIEAGRVRREPARVELARRREQAVEAGAERDCAASALASESEAYEAANRQIEGLEADVEAARSEVFSAINSATALRHSLEHAASARDRVAETLSKLLVEADDLRMQSDRMSVDHASAAEGLHRAQGALEATRVARTARESELASARIEHEWRARSVRTREQEMAGFDARLRSLEELEAARAGYGDAARAVLAQANGKVSQQGAVADYLEVDHGYERAVEACLGDLLQHVVVHSPEHAVAGFALVRTAEAGRCGFLIAEPESPGGVPEGEDLPDAGASPVEAVRLSSVVRVSGPYSSAIRQALGEAWIAPSYETAAAASHRSALPIASLGGELFRGPGLVSGGSPQQSRGILETKREIKDLRQRIEGERASLAALAEETSALDRTIAQASGAIEALSTEHHRQEKAIVGLEGDLRRAVDEGARLAQKAEQIARERRQAEEERDGLDRRQQEARTSIDRLDGEQRAADDRLTVAQRRLFEARESALDLSRRAADVGASHAALVERAVALSTEVRRLEDAFCELEVRAVTLAGEQDTTLQRVEALRVSVVEGQTHLDADVRALDMLRLDVREADDRMAALRAGADGIETGIRAARSAHEALRAAVSELDIARATADSDLTHLAHTCVESLQATLDDILAEVTALEAAGEATPDARAIASVGVADVDDDVQDERADEQESSSPDAAAAAAEQRALSAEDAITELRARIDRLGPVNMMAIDQFDELETRHTFLTTQRKDLVDSIAQTSEAIKRIDETTRQRFADAFTAINRHFQEIFGTLFGGGRAGLTLLDENDPIESGIEIIAQPPGKRLQSVQLLSGGEKALTAISLMFALFKYKPSPFCLLDEIDAPLDDANIGRFVEMLRGMQQHTQFILITHNRKTMEIADRLYGVTMEEPGVSKLISVQLN
jgi:chromosome segregation protein